MSSYVVTVPLAIVRDNDGVSHHFYEGGVVGFDSDHVKQLVEDGALVKSDSADAAPAGDPAPEDKPAKVNDIIAEVGDDKDKAAAALETEKARGDAARPTLLDKLQAVIDAS